MVKKIYLFLPPSNNTSSVLHFFTQEMGRALQQAGVKVLVLEADYHNPAKFIDTILADPPDCTLSFNGLLPDNEGRFFCDLIKIPHVACLVDSPNRFVQLIGSKRTIVTCPDRFSCQFFQGMGKSNVVFLPHAVSAEPAVASKEKKYDVVMFASCGDYEEMRSSWSGKYPTAVQWALYEAGEEALREDNRSYVEIFAEAFDRQLRSVGGGVDPTKINLVAILQDLEDYINAKDRIESIKSLEGVKVDLFGEGEKVWKKYLGTNNNNITIHGNIPYTDCVEVLKQSKISINSCPSLRLGGHLRAMDAFKYDAVCISSGSSYLRETFTDGKNILFYKYGQGINAQVHTLLNDEPKRIELVQRGKEVVLQNHTWNNRVAELLRHLPLMLENIRDLEKTPVI